MYRRDGPSWLSWNDEGALIEKGWSNGNGYYREDGPALLTWDANGTLIEEEWLQNDNYHRIGGPARRIWNSDGRLKLEEWAVDDQYHRIDGPAYQEWNEHGDVTERWYINGDEMTAEEIEKILRPEDIVSVFKAQLPQPIWEAIIAVYRTV